MTFKYLVYDIESIINRPLLNKVLYAGENLSDDEAYQKHVAEMQAEDPSRTFINPAFHKPISLACLSVNADYSIGHMGFLGGEQKTSASIVKHFWTLYNEKKPVLVDFNGRGYDIRLLELWAFQLGVIIDPRHFSKYGPRYRFSDEFHLDLHEFLTNNGAIRYRGGLDLFSKLLGKPGKMTTKGDMVEKLYEAKEFFQIDDYCLCDALDTYFVFLRTRVMMGQLGLVREQELVGQAKKKSEKKNQGEGFLKSYLSNFGEWVPFE